MKKTLSCLLVFTMVSITIAGPRRIAQDPAQPQAQSSLPAQITNKEVFEMVKAGLAPDIIVAKIKSSPSKFDTTPGTLADLKTAGIPDSVIMAMVQSTGEPISGSVASVASVPAVEVKIPDGTEIEIQLVNNLSGQEAKVGDIVDFTLVRAIQVNGVTVFERDASARARVTTAKKAGRWGKAGKLEWAMQDVQAVDGIRVPARFTKRELGDSKGGTVAVAAVATTILLGPLGLLWGLKKGKPAIIPAGNRYSIFIHGDAVAKGTPTTSASTAH
jgi:hypothetical protein